MSTQPMLGLEVAPTIAMRQGRAWIEGCRGCGCLVAVASSEVASRVPGSLGACPVCGRSDWYRPRVPEGPFREVDADA